MRPYVHSAGSTVHFQWNLDVSVGRRGTNSLRSDVSYIQWYYVLAAIHPLTPPDRRAIYRAVEITGSCDGSENDPLVASIFAQQRALSHPQVDGKISVASGDGKVGSSAFFVLRLGARFAEMFPQQWPRLDQIPRCPDSVKAAMRAAVPNISH